MTTPVTIDELIDAIRWFASNLKTNPTPSGTPRLDIIERIRLHGIAPPEGWVLVPVGDLRTVEHRLLNAERVFKRDLTNHKFMGFDLISSSIDIVGAMLAAAPKPEDV